MTTGQHDRSLAEQRLILRSDLVPESLAFIDCKLPGSTLKLNYSIIGSGVTQSSNQFVSLNEPHGFALGVAAMPHGVTNNLHLHYTAEVFMVYKGIWTFRWGADGMEGEIVGRAGDVISMPTWIFRGFTSSGPDDGWIFTLLGRDHSGGVVWHPSILRQAAEHGLFLRKDNTLVDMATGAAEPSDEDLVTPFPESFIETLRHYSIGEMAERLVKAEERAFSSHALLQSVLTGHRASLAPVIGPGMTEDRLASPRITNPHGFSLEWLRMEPGQEIGPFRLHPKQVLILQSGRLEITLGIEGGDGRAVAGPWDTFSMPANAWRTLRSVGEEPALVSITTAGDDRARIEWHPSIVAAALAQGTARDPDGYLAPAAYLPPSPDALTAQRRMPL